MLIISNLIPVVLILITLCFSSFAKSGEKQEFKKNGFSCREIERPLTIPQRNSELAIGYIVGRLYYNGGDLKEFNEMVVERGYPIIVPNYRYGFTNRLQLTIEWGMPSVDFQLINGSVEENGIVVSRRPSLAVGGGLYEINYSEMTGLEWMGHLSLYSKIPLSKKLWLDGSMRGALGNTGQIQSNYNISLGIQASNCFCVTPGISLFHSFELSSKNTQLFPRISSDFSYNLSDHFGMDYFLMAKWEKETMLAAIGVAFRFNW